MTGSTKERSAPNHNGGNVGLLDSKRQSWREVRSPLRRLREFGLSLISTPVVRLTGWRRAVTSIDLACFSPTQPKSIRSDPREQRGSRFVGSGEEPNREGTLFAGSAVRILRAKAHRSAVVATGTDRRAGGPIGLCVAAPDKRPCDNLIDPFHGPRQRHPRGGLDACGMRRAFGRPMSWLS